MKGRVYSVSKWILFAILFIAINTIFEEEMVFKIITVLLTLAYLYRVYQYAKTRKEWTAINRKLVKRTSLGLLVSFTFYYFVLNASFSPSIILAIIIGLILGLIIGFLKKISINKGLVSSKGTMTGFLVWTFIASIMLVNTLVFNKNLYFFIALLGLQTALYLSSNVIILYRSNNKTKKGHIVKSISTLILIALVIPSFLLVNSEDGLVGQWEVQRKDLTFEPFFYIEAYNLSEEDKVVGLRLFEENQKGIWFKDPEYNFQINSDRDVYVISSKMDSEVYQASIKGSQLSINYVTNPKTADVYVSPQTSSNTKPPPKTTYSEGSFEGVIINDELIEGTFKITSYDGIYTMTSDGRTLSGDEMSRYLQTWDGTWYLQGFRKYATYTGEFMAVKKDVAASLVDEGESGLLAILADLAKQSEVSPKEQATAALAMVMLMEFSMAGMKQSNELRTKQGHAIDKNGRIYFKPPWEEGSAYWMEPDEYYKTQEMLESNKEWSEYGWKDKQEIETLQQNRLAQQRHYQQKYEQRETREERLAKITKESENRVYEFINARLYNSDQANKLLAELDEGEKALASIRLNRIFNKRKEIIRSSEDMSKELIYHANVLDRYYRSAVIVDSVAESTISTMSNVLNGGQAFGPGTYVEYPYRIARRIILRAGEEELTTENVLLEVARASYETGTGALKRKIGFSEYSAVEKIGVNGTLKTVENVVFEGELPDAETAFNVVGNVLIDKVVSDGVGAPLGNRFRDFNLLANNEKEISNIINDTPSNLITAIKDGIIEK